MSNSIALGADHGGYELKESIKKHLEDLGIEYKDFGVYNTQSVDYPDIAHAVCNAVESGKHQTALLFCGTGVGMSIAANRHSGIRACVCSDTFSAKYTRLHNNANVLCLGGRVVGCGVAIELVDVFLNTEFEGGRHCQRIDKI